MGVRDPAAKHWRGVAEGLDRGCGSKEATLWPRWALSCQPLSRSVCSQGRDTSWPRPCQGPREQVGRATKRSPAGRDRKAIHMLSDRC